MTREIDFSKYSSIKVGSKIQVTILEDDFSDFQKYFILGGANNLLVSDTPPPLAILSDKYNYITYENNILTIGGATPSGKIFSFCKRNNIGGLEFLGKLPGKLGGLIKMNAGMKEYEIFNSLLTVTTHKKTLEKNNIEFGYRYTKIDGVILEATFKIEKEFDLDLLTVFENMRKNQPKDPSAGSVFKNPKGDSAGRLIDGVGLKGFKKGDMAWSDIHANFLVNLGNGNYKDSKYLIKLAKEKVKEKFGIVLEEEIELVESTNSDC
ncbi:MAG: UDP-N-acetylmuramate dehydrogenase [Campylobacterales bacterium]|nr:UDP-N-acetylmuramate dehydrogenase [Campylobacterales bacterium]